MDTKRISRCCPTQSAARAAAACLFAAALAVISTLAVAQDAKRSPGSNTRDSENVFESISRWFEKQGDKINSSFRDVRKNFEGFGQEAGMAARATVDNAKDAGDVLARIPKARVISGHEKCKDAPNGAPDCVAAATKFCKAKGFESGKSMDMTTAEVCPPQVYLSGRSSGSGCRTETFVSRILCQ